MTKLPTDTAMHKPATNCRLLIMGESRVPLAMATVSPAAIPAALEAQPSRASFRHRGRSSGHTSLIVMHQG